MEKPQYTHDCDCCIFLGRHTDEAGTLMDLYYHGVGWSTTVIARYSNEPGDYQSGLTFSYARQEPHVLVVAKNLAVKQGVLKETTFYIGYSEKRNDVLDAEFFNSTYYKDRPSTWEALLDIEDDEEYDRVEEQGEKDLNIYNEAWEQFYGRPVPKVSSSLLYFKSASDAEFHCGDEWISVDCCDKMYIESTAIVQEFSKWIFLPDQYKTEERKAQYTNLFPVSDL